MINSNHRLFDLNRIQCKCLIQLNFNTFNEYIMIISNIKKIMIKKLNDCRMSFYKTIEDFNMIIDDDLSIRAKIPFIILLYVSSTNNATELIKFKKKYNRIHKKNIIIMIIPETTDFNYLPGLTDYIFSFDHVIDIKHGNAKYKIIYEYDENSYINFMTSNKSSLLDMYDLLILIKNNNSLYHDTDSILYTELKYEIDKYFLIIMCMNKNNILIKDVSNIILSFLSQIIF